MPGQRTRGAPLRCHPDHNLGVQDISIVVSQTPMVYRAAAAGTDRVFITFEGLRESRTISDKRTRVRITMPAQTAVHLWQQLADDVPTGLGGAPIDPS